MKLQTPAAQSNVWSVLDQAMVSGANFFVGVLLARVLGLEGFGAYVIAQTYLLYGNTFQSALVVSPMMTAVPAVADGAAQQRLLGAFYAYSLAVILLTVAGVQAAAWTLGQVTATLGLGTLALPLALAMVSFQWQDWLRRALYVRLANRGVFLADMLAYGGQVAALAALAWAQQLSAANALLALAASFAVSALLTTVALRLRPDLQAMAQVFRTQWRLSRDFLASWQLQWLGSQGVILIGTGAVGPQAAGAIRAVLNLFGPVNVAFQWMDNVMPVRAAIRLREGGQPALRSYLQRLTWAGLVLLGLFALLLLPIDEWLMTTLYGEAYRPFAGLVVLYALYCLFGHAYRVQSYFYRAVGQIDELARASFWWAVAGVLCALATVSMLAEWGIMLALVAGEVVALAYLMGRRGALAPTSVAPHGWAAVKPGAGGATLMLPLAHRQVMQGALAMYFPSRWTGRLYRWALSILLPFWVWAGIGRTQGAEMWASHLPAVLAWIPGSRPEWVGGLRSDTGPRSKLTLRIMSHSGAALAYGRIASGPVAIMAVEREATLLAILSQSRAQNQVPSLIAHGPLTDPVAYFLAEGPGPEMPAGNRLDARHFRFLQALVNSKRMQSWASVTARVGGDWQPARDDGNDLSVVHDAIAWLATLPLGPLPVCIEHGDFAPWNIRQHASDQIFVFDWEHARLEGLPWLDALHFRYQIDVIVGRRRPQAALAGLLTVFHSEGAQPYCSTVNLPDSARAPLLAIYLLKALQLGRDEGAAFRAPEQLARLETLSLILREYAHARS